MMPFVVFKIVRNSRFPNLAVGILDCDACCGGYVNAFVVKTNPLESEAVIPSTGACTCVAASEESRLLGLGRDLSPLG